MTLGIQRSKDTERPHPPSGRPLGSPKARQVMQWMAPVLALGVAGVVPLEMMVQRTSSSMATGCTVNTRRKRPAAYQLVAQPKLIRGLG